MFTDNYINFIVYFIYKGGRSFDPVRRLIFLHDIAKIYCCIIMPYKRKCSKKSYRGIQNMQVFIYLNNHRLINYSNVQHIIIVLNSIQVNKFEKQNAVHFNPYSNKICTT